MKEEIIKAEYQVGNDTIEVIVSVENGVYSAEVIKK